MHRHDVFPLSSVDASGTRTGNYKNDKKDKGDNGNKSGPVDGGAGKSIGNDGKPVVESLPE